LFFFVLFFLLLLLPPLSYTHTLCCIQQHTFCYNQVRSYRN
jgi:hypothetical protein